MGSFKRNRLVTILASAVVMLASLPIFASEADLKIPNLSESQNHLLLFGFLICFLGIPAFESSPSKFCTINCGPER